MAGCSSLRPLSAARTLDKYSAKEVCEVVAESYSFTPVLVTHTLPAGTYAPVLEDDEGVYYQSPSKLLIGDLFGPTLHDGGLFFKEGVSTEVYDCVIVNDRHSKWKLPDDFKFRIEKRP